MPIARHFLTLGFLSEAERGTSEGESKDPDNAGPLEVASRRSHEAAWWELPGAASQKRHLRDPSTPRLTASRESDFRGAPLRKPRNHELRAHRTLLLAFVPLLTISSIPGSPQLTRSESKPAVEINVDQAAPREVNDTVQQAITRDYSAAWQALVVALADNNAAALNENFVGFAQDKLAQRIKDQQQAGLRTRIVDRGHKVAAVFYSTEGATIELEDTANLETQILDGDTVLHSEHAQLRYWVIMTGAEDRWKVRVMESARGD